MIVKEVRLSLLWEARELRRAKGSSGSRDWLAGL